MGCLFLADSITWADPSSATTLAAESRLKPFFEKHGLDFQNLATVVYTAGKLRDLVTSGSLRESHIMNLNRLFPDGAIKIDKGIKQGALRSGKVYNYAVFRFEKEQKTIKALFIKDHNKLTDDELSELRIRKDEVYHLDYPGLEGIWFVNPAAIPAPDMPYTWGDGPDTADLSADLSAEASSGPGVTAKADGAAPNVKFLRSAIAELMSRMPGPRSRAHLEAMMRGIVACKETGVAPTASAVAERAGITIHQLRHLVYGPLGNEHAQTLGLVLDEQDTSGRLDDMALAVTKVTRKHPGKPISFAGIASEMREKIDWQALWLWFKRQRSPVAKKIRKGISRSRVAPEKGAAGHWNMSIEAFRNFAERRCRDRLGMPTSALRLGLRSLINFRIIVVATAKLEEKKEIPTITNITGASPHLTRYQVNDTVELIGWQRAEKLGVVKEHDTSGMSASVEKALAEIAKHMPSSGITIKLVADALKRMGLYDMTYGNFNRWLKGPAGKRFLEKIQETRHSIRDRVDAVFGRMTSAELASLDKAALGRRSGLSRYAWNTWTYRHRFDFEEERAKFLDEARKREEAARAVDAIVNELSLPEHVTRDRIEAIAASASPGDIQKGACALITKARELDRRASTTKTSGEKKAAQDAAGSIYVRVFTLLQISGADRGLFDEIRPIVLQRLDARSGTGTKKPDAASVRTEGALRGKYEKLMNAVIDTEDLKDVIRIANRIISLLREDKGLSAEQAAGHAEGLLDLLDEAESSHEQEIADTDEAEGEAAAADLESLRAQLKELVAESDDRPDKSWSVGAARADGPEFETKLSDLFAEGEEVSGAAPDRAAPAGASPQAPNETVKAKMKKARDFIFTPDLARREEKGIPFLTAPALLSRGGSVDEALAGIALRIKVSADAPAGKLKVDNLLGYLERYAPETFGASASKDEKMMLLCRALCKEIADSRFYGAMEDAINDSINEELSRLKRRIGEDQVKRAKMSMRRRMYNALDGLREEASARLPKPAAAAASKFLLDSQADRSAYQFVAEPAVTPIAIAQAEADRIHDENLKAEYMPTIPDKTILCHIITDSIVPAEQQNMLKVALEQNMEKEAEKGTDYGEGFACLSSANAGNPGGYIKDLQSLMQKKRDDYKALGYTDVRFDVACPDTGLVSAVLGSNPGIKALAFEPCKGADFDLVQVEGIMLALRALDSGDIEKLKSVFILLAGNRLSPEQSAIMDIDKFIKTVSFILPAAKVEDYNERRRLNDLITANIKQAA